MDYFLQHKAELDLGRDVYLRIKVLPGAGETELKGTMEDGTLKIAVAAAPEKGKANKELVRFLADEFGVDKDRVRIISGAGDRLKLVKIINSI